MDLKRLFLDACIVLFGSLLFASLSWLPVAGAIASGFITGYLLRSGLRKSLIGGLSSGAIGSMIVLYSALNLGLTGLSPLSLIIGSWLFILYFTLAVVVNAIACAVGCMYSSINMIAYPFLKNIIPPSGSGILYSICPICGRGIHVGADCCINSAGVHCDG
ncbi:hypothetical protein ACFLRF_01970 [Candidatus Altiarchaeota archaeon]